MSLVLKWTNRPEMVLECIGWQVRASRWSCDKQPYPSVSIAVSAFTVSMREALPLIHVLKKPKAMRDFCGFACEYLAPSSLHFFSLSSSFPLGRTMNQKCLLGNQANWSTWCWRGTLETNTKNGFSKVRRGVGRAVLWRVCCWVRS